MNRFGRSLSVFTHWSFTQTTYKSISNYGRTYSTRSNDLSTGFRNLSWISSVAGVVGVALGITLWTKKNKSVTKQLASSTSKEKIQLDAPPNKGKSEISVDVIINESRDLAQRIKDETGSPGLLITVTVDGKTVWEEGLGYADVENRVQCGPETVMRIASISKSITMAAVAKLYEMGQLDLDKPVQHYVKEWPEKTINGEPVTITTRQLVSHLAGVRHYDKTCEKHKKKDNDKNKNNTTDKEKANKDIKDEKSDKNGKNAEKKKSEFEQEEYYIQRYYENVASALTLFKDDKLCSKPGTEFLYTTHGWTLVSAVMEGASGQKLSFLLKGLFKDIGLYRTYFDENEPLIYNRARHYVKDKNGRLVNARYVDCSYKWSGGGLLSNTGDLAKFGGAMLFSYQQRSQTPTGSLPGYLKPDTMKMLWTVVPGTECSWDRDGGYGMGWAVIPEKVRHANCRETRFYVSHTGGAIGGSSVLLVLPRKNVDYQKIDKGMPQGVVVAMIANMQAVGLNKTALEIAKKFEALNL